MTLFADMKTRLEARMKKARQPYPCFVFLSDSHVVYDRQPAGFRKILEQAAGEQPLFVLIGGDLVDSGYYKNYQRFIDTVTVWTRSTGIPVIPTMGNHEYILRQGEHNPSDKTGLDFYRNHVGPENFRLEITKGLAASLTLIAFHDAKPEYWLRPAGAPSSPVGATAAFQLGYNDFNESHFGDNLVHSKSNHIIVTMHVPPQLTILRNAIDRQIHNNWPALSLPQVHGLATYYRNLWTLQDGNADAENGLESVRYLSGALMAKNEVEMVLTGHIHTYLTWQDRQDGHTVDYVISGGGGNDTASAFQDFPDVVKYHYVRVAYNQGAGRFEHTPVNVD